MALTEFWIYESCEVMAAGHQPLKTHARSKAKWRGGIRESFEHPLEQFTAEADLYMIQS